MFPLLSLPLDLVHPIVESIDNPDDLLSLAQTCTKLQPLAEAALWKQVHIRNGESADRLLASLEARPHRFGCVQELEITPHPRSTWHEISILPSLIRKMGNLRVLQLESPFINYFNRGERYKQYWIDQYISEYLRLFEDSSLEDGPLTNLTSFTFHSHGAGTRYYKLDTIYPVLLSSTLTHLHISCSDVNKFEVPDANLGKSPLRTLVLDECNVTSEGLSTLLSLPRGLEYLYLQETSHHGSSIQSNMPMGPIFAAISQQKHSLQHLQHSCSKRGYSDWLPNDEPDFTGFSLFYSLKTLELDDKSPLKKLLPVPQYAPPNLDTFCFTGLECRPDTYWDDMPSRVNSISNGTNFKHLELHTSPASTNSLSRMFSLPSRVLKLVEIARNMKERNITTTLTNYTRYSVIPPYVYGERRPVPVVYFESEKFWPEEETQIALMEAFGNKPFELEDKECGTMVAAKLAAGRHCLDY
ncbi:hypothetical protein BDV95DRAFT_589513 [Massariosphaeria phaeospora]|uniref:F-box domain-containing protein n=1 Tax=Massariosphaeria phaeospora TaxID=100035 RepID=A0A7C8MLT8_9PLEO|nr:hypothetical protein BDV95DRAFT_589513 [Massariosphaeria phaeospora]